MKTLTKKYRLIWNDNKQLLLDPYIDRTGTTTHVGSGRHYFQSDNLEEIENKISNENLVYETI